MTQILAASLAALIAAAVAVTGFLVNASRERRQRQAALYADALRVIVDLQEYPYRVFRRQGETAEIRHELDDAFHDLVTRMNYHLHFLRLESPVVADAYFDLLEATRRRSGTYRRWSWLQPALSRDADMATNPPFDWDVEAELVNCIQAMKVQMEPWARFRLGKVREQLRARAEVISDADLPTQATVTQSAESGRGLPRSDSSTPKRLRPWPSSY